MFSQESKFPKLAILESKLSMYEELSREMLSKLEKAVEKISEGNIGISKILVKHDEKLEQCDKTDGTIIKMIDELREENKQDHAEVVARIDKLEVKVDDFVKFRWIVVGGLIIISFIFSQSGIVRHILTPDQTPAKLERAK